jgi:hypothetical protein
MLLTNGFKERPIRQSTALKASHLTWKTASSMLVVTSWSRASLLIDLIALYARDGMKIREAAHGIFDKDGLEWLNTYCGMRTIMVIVGYEHELAEAE